MVLTSPELKEIVEEMLLERMLLLITIDMSLIKCQPTEVVRAQAFVDFNISLTTDNMFHQSSIVLLSGFGK